MTDKDLVHEMKKRGILHSPRIEQALRKVQREDYGPSGQSLLAIDAPQSIGFQATISALHMHVICLELLHDQLQPGAFGLDVGSGSGFLTAVMGLLVQPGGQVVGIEHIPELVELGRSNINSDQPQLLIDGTVVLVEGDGRRGYPTAAPYDFIHVGAAASTVPAALVDQLKPGGRLIIPVGPQDGAQNLMQFDKRTDGSLSEQTLGWVTYVPLVDRSEQVPLS